MTPAQHRSPHGPRIILAFIRSPAQRRRPPPPPRDAPPREPLELPRLAELLEPRDLACESRFMLLLFEGDDQPPLLLRDCQLPFEFWRETLPLRSP
jgi:hypothetical protein